MVTFIRCICCCSSILTSVVNRNLITLHKIRESKALSAKTLTNYYSITHRNSVIRVGNSDRGLRVISTTPRTSMQSLTVVAFVSPPIVAKVFTCFSHVFFFVMTINTLDKIYMKILLYTCAYCLFHANSRREGRSISCMYTY